MQLIYGNDGTNYRTIAKSQSMKPVQEKRLLEGYKKYDFVEDSTLYSSAAKEPTALTYVTTDLSGTLEKAQILLAYNARMTNYAAESSYAHFRFWDADKKTYGEDFLSLLSEGFVPDTELNKYNNENIDNFDEKRNYIPDTQALKADVLIAAVKALLFAVDKKGCRVKITLDVEGDDYNTRALDVIASVYSCIPYNIRKKAGFCTYSSSDDNMPEQIKLIISPCSKGKKPDKIVVNLFRYGKCYKGNTADKEMDEQITRFAKIVVRKPEWRDKWFTICQEAFQLKNTSVKEHIELILKTHWWGKKKIEYIGDELAAYFYKEQKNIGDSIVGHFLNIVENRFKIDEEWFRTAIKEKLDSQNTFAFNQRMQEYIMLGEIVSQASFYPDDFLEWEQRKMLDPLVKDYPDEREIYKELEKKLQELLELQKKPYGAEKYQKIDLEMKQRLERELEELKKLIEKQVAEEKEVIESFIAEKKP
ncbi:MAG: hypothetical protein K2L07_11605, partial [Lachnospiraceae bacterium]|nr:hypothetical protein [Lachnospiraceae bacterium]